MVKNRKGRSVQDQARDVLAWLDSKMVGAPVNLLDAVYLYEFHRRANDLWDAFYGKEFQGFRDRHAIDVFVKALDWEATDNKQLREFVAGKHRDRALPRGIEHDSARWAMIRSALRSMAERPVEIELSGQDGPDIQKRRELSATERAVLTIIEGQPKGQGIGAKEIVAKLKAEHINLKTSTLHRHVFPALKASHGVVNHPAAGGYLIQPPGNRD